MRLLLMSLFDGRARSALVGRAFTQVGTCGPRIGTCGGVDALSLVLRIVVDASRRFRSLLRNVHGGLRADRRPPAVLRAVTYQVNKLHKQRWQSMAVLALLPLMLVPIYPYALY